MLLNGLGDESGSDDGTNGFEILTFLHRVRHVGLSILSIHVGVAISATDATAIYNYPLGSNANYTFALNIPDGSNDLYFHLSGPASYSWVGVGTGARMENSMMIVAYSSADGKNVTVSPRLSSGESEPVYSTSIDVTLLDGTGLANNTMTVNGRCNNCTSWKTGSLDVQSSSQPWNFALGPSGSSVRMLRSDSKTASIERHSKYGVFNVDMVHATGGSGSLPSSYTTSQGTQSETFKSDSNWPSIIHAVAACIAIIFLFPFGAILLRVYPKSVRWHWVNQTLSSCIAIVSLVIGFYLSTQFTKSQSWGSTHQIIGIIILLAIIVQWAMGFWHHLQYKKTQSATKFGVVHRYFGFIVIFLAIINGGIGMSWSYASTGAIVGYSVLVAVVSAVFIGLLGWARLGSRRGAKGFDRQSEEELSDYRTLGDDLNSDMDRATAWR
ncbi:hypothetical protein N7539_001357 [Penicillium diatomitis]|uniref:DOMON domain-containing protein n=1 Tax=Penicillium diatomitis TaxID=2819901 RepID=A0A9X0BZT7_9EURO|nr:uncharacterized protein N7539_001357 [Penicillium diatomitis]KAJ5492611.1 hypothetical protein N7539_001357 [Penicillium diatomitis]